MPIDSFIVTFSTLEWQFSVKWIVTVLSDTLLKPNCPFVFSLPCLVLLSDNLIKVLFPTLKTKLTVNESLDLSLSCRKLICCNRFGRLFPFALFNKWMMGSAFCNTKVFSMKKMLSLGVYGLKILETDLEICFVEQIVDTVMKLALHLLDFHPFQKFNT